MPVINSIMSIILCAKNAMNTLPTTYKIRYRRIQDTVRLAWGSAYGVGASTWPKMWLSLASFPVLVRGQGK